VGLQDKNLWIGGVDMTRRRSRELVSMCLDTVMNQPKKLLCLDKDVTIKGVKKKKKKVTKGGVGSKKKTDHSGVSCRKKLTKKMPWDHGFLKDFRGVAVGVMLVG